MKIFMTAQEKRVYDELEAAGAQDAYIIQIMTEHFGYEVQVV